MRISIDLNIIDIMDAVKAWLGNDGHLPPPGSAADVSSEFTYNETGDTVIGMRVSFDAVESEGAVTAKTGPITAEEAEKCWPDSLAAAIKKALE